MTGSRLARSPEPRHRWWRRIGFGVVVVVAALAGPALAAFLAIPVAAQVVYPPRLASTPAPVTAPRPAAINPDKPTAVFVLSAAGTNIADSLGPYEVFASTGAMNVVTAAATAEPVALTGGVDLVPDFTFDDLARRLPGPPDVIVVPELAGSPTVVVDWLTGEHRRGAPLIMSVCVGAEWLAQAGLLDARPATSNWLGLIGLRRSHPEVNWTDGVRFVDDGRIITTGAVLSGIDGSIRAVERILGPTAAQRVADELHWPGYRPGQSTSTPVSRLAPTDVVALLSAAYRWDRPATGVLLTDGVGEIELASAFRPYTTLSWVAALTSVTRDGEPVRTRHGLTLYPRGAWATVAPTLDRLIVPGHQAAVSHPSDNLPGAPPTVYLHEQAGFPFDGSLRDIASTYDGSTARWVAKSLQYPTPALAPGPVWPWMPTIRLTLLAALGVGALLLSRWLWISTRRRVAPQSPDDPHVRRQTPAPMLTTRRAEPLPQWGNSPLARPVRRASQARSSSVATPTIGGLRDRAQTSHIATASETSSPETRTPMDYTGLLKRPAVPAGASVPTRLSWDGLVATAITRDDLADDVRGINASTSLIRRTRGGPWPDQPVTEESNYVDLVWHECEFRDEKSFTYVLRTASGVYLGCCYLYPIGSRTPVNAALLTFDVDVSWWVTPDGYAHGYYAKAYEALRHWFATDFSYWRPHYSNVQIPTGSPDQS